MPQIYHPSPDQLLLQHVLYALADPSRLRLVKELVQGGELPSTGFTSVQAARGTIAFHLKVLRLAGITWTRQDGTRRMVSLRRKDLDCFPGLLHAILAPPSTTPTPSA